MVLGLCAVDKINFTSIFPLPLAPFFYLCDCGDLDWDQGQGGLGQAGLWEGRSSWLQQPWWTVHIEMADLRWLTMDRKVSLIYIKHY